MFYSTMIKLSLLFIFAIFCYVQCVPTESSTTSGPVVAAVLLDTKDEPNLQILATLNQSIVENPLPKNASGDMDDYYNWLTFIKSSTAASNSSEILLEKI